MRTIIFGLLAAAAMQGALAATITVGEADNGKTVALHDGQCVDVRLTTQAASTGYDWYMAHQSTELLKLESRTVTTPGNAVPGTPAQLDFVLCAVRKGEGLVTFQLYRPWEKNTPPAKTLAFTVKVGS